METILLLCRGIASGRASRDVVNGKPSEHCRCGLVKDWRESKRSALHCPSFSYWPRAAPCASIAATIPRSSQFLMRLRQ
jgi:hypothetical protein